MPEKITILDNGQPISFSFEDLCKYHGFGYPGGVAHAFKIMQRAFPLLDNGHPPERHELFMETAFPGPGARDAFEMVTRMVTGGRYHVDTDLPGIAAQSSGKGRYLFRFKYRGKAIDLTLRPGFVVDEFITLGAKNPRTPEDEMRLITLKNELKARLLAVSAEAAYEATPTE